MKQFRAINAPPARQPASRVNKNNTRTKSLPILIVIDTDGPPSEPTLPLGVKHMGTINMTKATTKQAQQKSVLHPTMNVVMPQ